MLHHFRQGRRRLAVEMERLRLRSDAPARDARAAVRTLPPEPAVTFLCLGNICRSPLAERYFEARLSTVEYDCATVRSAGFIEKEGRSSPDAAVSVAGEFGVDLTDHRSQCVDGDLLRESDLVLLMDAWNYRHLKGHYPDELDKAYFLKSFVTDDEFEIEDPYSADAATFRRVYGEVTDAVDVLVAALEDG
ncbi:low molecular weight phosphotyrosine protein phosphatase [Haladaptatus halobius]|uniref:arsenate reductase/protein-tyrosine-phosphatase family protein n=1 Tax=Haladaptatus halobius TaxID=2884875 RepID=UPI001D0A1343|nr:low molecular weight phosphotyrosine protein phosphatase [Haladaptatus halobius]